MCTEIDLEPTLRGEPSSWQADGLPASTPLAPACLGSALHRAPPGATPSAAAVLGHALLERQAIELGEAAELRGRPAPLPEPWMLRPSVGTWLRNAPLRKHGPPACGRCTEPARLSDTSRHHEGGSQPPAAGVASLEVPDEIAVERMITDFLGEIERKDQEICQLTCELEQRRAASAREGGTRRSGGWRVR